MGQTGRRPLNQAGQQAIAQHNARVATANAHPAAKSVGGNTFVFNGSQYPTTEQMAELKRTFAHAVGV